MSSGTGHRLLVLGSMDEFVKLVTMAQERGIYVIVCDGYANGPAKKIANKSYDIDVRDVDAIANLCRSEAVDGIISSFSDVLAECLVAIAEKAGLPTYISSSDMRYLRDKTLMKRMFDELEIPYPKSALVRRDSIDDDLADIHFPCVIKPTNAYGSHGVFMVDSMEEVRRHFDASSAHSSTDYILAEEYNNGFEFNMMNWVVDGEPVVLEIADREKTPEVAFATPHVSRIVYPSRLTDQVLEEARAIASRVARYVHMENGPLCIQFFWSPDEGIQVCECAGRIFGYEHELLELASSVSVEELLLDYVYDREALREALRNHSPYLDSISAGLYFHGREGVIGSVEGVPSTDDEGIEEVISYYTKGETIRHNIGDKPYVVRIYLRGDTYEFVDSLSDKLFHSVCVSDTEGNSMLYRNEIATY